MSDKKTPAERMMTLLTGNLDMHYTADFRNLTLEENGKRVPQYDDVAGAPTIEEFEDHLAGKKGLLIIPVTRAGSCRWGKIDVDIYPCDGKAFALKIHRFGLPLIVEFSKSAGVHLAHYSRIPISATDLREKLFEWAVMLGCSTKVEIFPKQDRLAEKENGTGINLPYFNGDKGTQFAIDKDGKRLTVEEWLTAAERLPAKAQYKQGEVQVETVVDFLVQHWTDGQRDNMNLAAAGAMLRAGLDEAIVANILELTQSAAADNEKRRSVEGIAKALADTDANKKIPGFTKLTEMMGRDKAQEFMKLVGAQPAAEPFPTELVMNADAFLAMELPPREAIIEGLLYDRSIAQVHALRGVGKSWVMLNMALSISKGEQFLAWPVPTPRSVLYVDGEMSAVDLQGRIRLLNGPGAVPSRFMMMASELFHRKTDGSLNISDPAQRDQFEAMLAALADEGRQPALIIFDNLSALTSGTEENSNTEQAPLSKWFIRLRHMGYTLFIVHHSAKTGQQRGASGREDALDLVMRLKTPDGPRGDRTRVELDFEKSRDEWPKPPTVNIELVTDETGTLRLAMDTSPQGRQTGIEQKFWILLHIAETAGVTRSAVATRFGITPSTAKEHVQKLIAAGLVTGAKGPLSVTDKGLAKVEVLWPGRMEF